MQVTRGQIIVRGVTNNCPNCGAKTLFKQGSLFELNPECPACGLKIEHDEGFYLGSLSLNYGVTVIGFLVPILILYLTGVLSGRAASILAAAGAVGVPILFYRASRSWWLMSYYFFLPRHLPANRDFHRHREDKNI